MKNTRKNKQRHEHYDAKKKPLDINELFETHTLKPLDINNLINLLPSLPSIPKPQEKKKRGLKPKPQESITENISFK